MLTAGAVAISLGGRLRAPSSDGPPYETYEVDDGPVYGPGLEAERQIAFDAGLVTTEADGGAFQSRLTPTDRQFIDRIEFPTDAPPATADRVITTLLVTCERDGRFQRGRTSN